MEPIDKIKTWLSVHLAETGVRTKKKHGYKALFDGPRAADKLTKVKLLGKEFKKKVFRVDLRQIVSEYIGETEKNLDAVFNKVGSKDWILFFDEADALFGKRTDVRDAHDKYANAEVSYLMQRIEAYPGLVILATNSKSNIDSSFVRRFQTVLQFENA